MSVNSIMMQNYFSNLVCAEQKPADTSFNDSIFMENEKEEMNVAAHRGYSSIAPENTIPAIIKAAENGYDTVEVDISWTKDNVPVLLHDKTINRTARKENDKKPFFPKKCSKMTYEELLKYDFGSWFSDEFKGTKIPSFNELLECGKEYNLDLYIELKDTDDFNEERAKILAQSVKDAGLEDKITWISFNSDYLKTMRSVMPNSRLGYLSKKEVNEDTIKTLESLKNGENEVFLDIKSSKITKKGDNMLDEAGFDFEAWTIDNTEKLDTLKEYGCIGITSNSISEDEIEEYFTN